MEIQVLPQITGALGNILAYVLGHVIGRSHGITDTPQRAVTVTVLEVRPGTVIALAQLPGVRRHMKRGQRQPVKTAGVVLRQIVDETMNVPHTILVPLRHQEHIKLETGFLAHVPDHQLRIQQLGYTSIPLP